VSRYGGTDLLATPRHGSHRAGRKLFRFVIVPVLVLLTAGTAVGAVVATGKLQAVMWASGPDAVGVSLPSEEPTVTIPPAAQTPTDPPSTTGTATPTTPSASPSASASSAPRSTSSSARTSSRKSAAPAAPAAPSTGDAIVQAVLDQLNQARAEQGVSALSLSTGLSRAASKHSQLMAGGCGMSHQCPGEAGLGTRISAEGVSWHSVGENVGYGGPVSSSQSSIISMAKRLTSSMLAETPPNDGHRRNILNSGFHRVGISVYRDSSGTVWMTQDFAG
jgi:uncharacterized protein YkwD